MPSGHVTSSMRKISQLLTVAVLLACLPGAAHAAAAGPNSGSFRMDKIKTSFAHGCGYRIAGDDGPRRLLILASLAMDCAAADTGFDPYEALKATLEEAKADYVVLYVSDDGTTIQNGHWVANDPSDGFSFGGQGKAEMKRADPTRVEGHYFTEKPDTFFDKTYEFDLRFALDLRSGSLEGTQLAAGGGAPGKVYLDYVAATAKSDGKALKKLVTGSRASGADYYSDEEFATAIRSGSELKAAKIASGLQKGDRAALTVSGTTYNDEKARGRVFLRQVGGVWKVETTELSPVY